MNECELKKGTIDTSTVTVGHVDVEGCDCSGIKVELEGGDCTVIKVGLEGGDCTVIKGGLGGRIRRAKGGTRGGEYPTRKEAR